MTTPPIVAVQRENDRLEREVIALKRGRATLAARLATVEAENRVLRAARDVAIRVAAWGGRRAAGSEKG